MTDLVSSKVSVESIYSEVKNRKIKGNIYAQCQSVKLTGIFFFMGVLRWFWLHPSGISSRLVGSLNKTSVLSKCCQCIGMFPGLIIDIDEKY